ncbi:hypothetical protein Bca101_049186 [Brassica carinata]
MQAYYGGGGTPNPFFPSKDQAIFVGVKLAIIQRQEMFVDLFGDFNTELEESLGMSNLLANLLVLKVPVHNTPRPSMLRGHLDREQEAFVLFHQITFYNPERDQVLLRLHCLDPLLCHLGLPVCTNYLILFICLTLRIP